jgi:hypothetical protein
VRRNKWWQGQKSSLHFSSKTTYTLSEETGQDQQGSQYFPSNTTYIL